MRLIELEIRLQNFIPSTKPTQDNISFGFPIGMILLKKNLYGIEISEQISRAAKMNMIIHDDGHTNVITSDGLISDESIIAKTNNHGFKYGTFDFIITNPPFGSTIRQSEQAYLKNLSIR